MRRFRPQSILAGVLMSIALAIPALGALEERPAMTKINDNLAVLRFLYRQLGAAQGNLDMVRSTKKLTQEQREVLQKFYDEEAAKGTAKRAEIYKVHIGRLDRQLKRLGEFDFEKIYGDRIAKLTEQIETYDHDLDIRLKEYNALFGKQPVVDMDYPSEAERARKQRPNATSFLDLD